MRDAFGGTFMFKIFIIFLVFYISFMTLAVSYAKVFRIKNRVIDMLEFSQYEGKADNTRIIDGSIRTYLDNLAYVVDDDISASRCIGERVVYSNRGLCIKDSNREDGSFEVTLYLVVKFPLFSNIFVIPVSGETRSYND